MDSRLISTANEWMQINPYGETQNPGAFVKWCGDMFGFSGGGRPIFLEEDEGARGGHNPDWNRNYSFRIHTREKSSELHLGFDGMMCVKFRRPEYLPIVFAFIFEKMNSLETRDKELNDRIDGLEKKLEQVNTVINRQQKSLDLLLEKILEDECDSMFTPVVEAVECVQGVPCVASYMFNPDLD